VEIEGSMDDKDQIKNKPEGRNFCAVCNCKDFNESPVGSKYTKRECIRCGFIWPGVIAKPKEVVFLND